MEKASVYCLTADKGKSRLFFCISANFIKIELIVVPKTISVSFASAPNVINTLRATLYFNIYNYKPIKSFSSLYLSKLRFVEKIMNHINNDEDNLQQQQREQVPIYTRDKVVNFLREFERQRDE